MALGAGLTSGSGGGTGSALALSGSDDGASSASPPISSSASEPSPLRASRSLPEALPSLLTMLLLATSSWSLALRSLARLEEPEAGLSAAVVVGTGPALSVAVLPPPAPGCPVTDFSAWGWSLTPLLATPSPFQYWRFRLRLTRNSRYMRSFSSTRKAVARLSTL